MPEVHLPKIDEAEAVPTVQPSPAPAVSGPRPHLSHIYVAQANYGGLTTGMLQAMYLRPPREDLAAFYRSAELFYSDMIYMEPALLKQYDEILPELDRALGGPSHK